MKIGIISDTHGLLRPEVLAALDGSDIILHGGDINRQDIIDRLSQIAPVKVVRGNNDRDWAEHIPLMLDLEIGGMRVCMAHKKKDLPADLSPYDLAVVGHTHKYEETILGKTVILNPGSCGPRRFHQAITMANAEINHGKLSVTRIDIPHEGRTAVVKTDRADLNKQIELIVKETQKNRTPSEIVTRHGLDKDLVDQIVRLYLTHPGVTTDGIRKKMGL